MSFTEWHLCTTTSISNLFTMGLRFFSYHPPIPVNALFIFLDQSLTSVWSLLKKLPNWYRSKDLCSSLALPKKSRHQQFFFVNNRFIKSGFLHHAVMSAFEGLLSPNHQPGYYLYLTVPPKQLDINIHPTKTEVKFEEEHAIYAVLRAAVKHSLGQFSIAPVLDFTQDKSLDTPLQTAPSSTRNSTCFG